MLRGWKWTEEDEKGPNNGNSSSTKEALEEDEKEANKKYQVPLELEAAFTPQEVESAQQLFEELDTDESGSIDVEELEAAFEKLGEQVSRAQIIDLVKQIDADESGSLDFGEFLHLLNAFKSGDSKFAKISKLYSQLGTTPLAILEKECERRGISVRYEFSQFVEANSMHPAQFIMCAVLHGEWKELDKNGNLCVSTEERRYQGLGKNTRLAKFAAATTALSKLREFLPGIDYAPGEIPTKWLHWFDDNVDRGVNELKLLEKLHIKGFFPAKNLLFMQKLSLRVSMLRLQARMPDLWPLADGRELPVEWIHWAQERMKEGLHGQVVLESLVENGFNPNKNPLLATLLEKDTGGSFSDPVKSKVFDFWSCSANGLVEELRRYVAGGQDPNETKRFAGHDTSPLALAIRYQQFEAIKFLVEAGADVNQCDGYGRVASHLAAQVGSVEITKYLISKDANVVVTDRYGDSPLHIAAAQGHQELVSFLLEWYEERIRRLVSGKDIIEATNETFKQAACAVYQHLIKTRLSPFAAPIFRKTWLFSALDEFFQRYHGQPLTCVVSQAEVQASLSAGSEREEEEEEEKPETEGTEDSPSGEQDRENDPVILFVQREDPRKSIALPKPTQQNAQYALNRLDLHPEEENFKEEEFVYVLESFFLTSWTNQGNSIGRTALMCAVDPSGEANERHEKILHCIVDDHGCEVRMKDKYGKTAISLLETKLGRLGESFLEEVQEERRRREKEEIRQREQELEPLQTDPLYKMLEEAGEISTQWSFLLKKSSRLRTAGPYSEMHHPNSKLLFYVDEVGACQWSKPADFVRRDEEQYGWMQLKMESDRIATYGTWDVFLHRKGKFLFYHNYESSETQFERPEDTKISLPPPVHVPSKSELICTVGFWTKWKSAKAERVYYVNEKHGKVQYERPLEWSSYADESDITPHTVQPDWEVIFSASDMSKRYGEWEERRENVTQNFFYWHKPTRTGTWERPRPVMELDQGYLLYLALTGREGGRERKHLEVLRTAVDFATGIQWREERDNFLDRSVKKIGSVKVVYFVGEDPDEGRKIAQGACPEVFDESDLQPIQAQLNPTKTHRFSSVRHLTQRLISKESEGKSRFLKRLMARLEAADERMSHGYVLCGWGCKEWTEPSEVESHRLRQCRKRLLPCKFGCGLVLRDEQWKVLEKIHSTMECPRRLVPCDKLCGELVVFEQMQKHLTTDCVKRPVPPLPCKFKCGWKVSGGLEDQEQMQWEANQHEEHACPLRTVRCDWPGCMAELLAKERPNHRQEHLKKIGIVTWTTAGTYTWKVPRKCRSLLVHVWGGGGGAGILRGRRGGVGGGGGFVEAQLNVYPQEELIIVVGSGGETRNDDQPFDYIDDDNFERISKGGFPGGGDGISNNYTFSCGGGGGYSAILRHGPFGDELLLLAAGGGGGGCRDGGPGGGEHFDCIDFDGVQRNGGQATQEEGGTPGECPENVRRGLQGEAYQGGRGGLFGGGGGGGLYGGGGGGFTPGIVGGGGGGSNYVLKESVSSFRFEVGSSLKPGGAELDLPAATGLGEWDLTGKLAGFGGSHDKVTAEPGSSGAVRIKLPRYFETTLPETRVDIADLEIREDEDAKSCSTCSVDAEEEQAEPDNKNVPDEPNDIEEDHDADWKEKEEEEDDDSGNEEASLPSELYANADVEWVPGMRVLCHYRGKLHNPKYPATIFDVNADGTFEIEYDDGDMDSNIPPAAVSVAIAPQ